MGAKIAKELGVYNEEEKICTPKNIGHERYRLLNNDPRSVTAGINRTPIQVECTPTGVKSLPRARSVDRSRLDYPQVDQNQEHDSGYKEEEVSGEVKDENKCKTPELVRYLETDIDKVDSPILNVDSPLKTIESSSSDIHHSTLIFEEKHESVLVDKKRESVLVDDKNESMLVEEKHELMLVEEKHESMLVEEKHELILVEEKHESMLVEEKQELVLVEEKHESVLVEDKTDSGLVDFLSPTVKITRTPHLVECTPELFALHSHIDSLSFCDFDVHNEDPSAIVTDDELSSPRNQSTINHWLFGVENKMATPGNDSFADSPKTVARKQKELNALKKQLFFNPDVKVADPIKPKARTPLGDLQAGQLRESPQRMLKAKQWRNVAEERKRRGLVDTENTPPNLHVAPLTVASAPGKIMERKRTRINWDSDDAMVI